ncbi:MAG: saccharopine dehydrogenase NADP-binding domain-containing protein, partial [Betaproteobacteria bacterium]
MRIVVLGGYGNFGARISRALALDRSLIVFAAGRHAPVAAQECSAAGIQSIVLDNSSADFAQALQGLKPALVIHCVGPFQGQGYGVARAALACGAHYIDLSDGRDFVAGFGAALEAEARRAKRLAVTGASTLP